MVPRPSPQRLLAKESRERRTDECDQPHLAKPRSILPQDGPQSITDDGLFQGAGQGVVGELGSQFVVEREWPARLTVLPGESSWSQV